MTCQTMLCLTVEDGRKLALYLLDLQEWVKDAQSCAEET